MNLILIFLAFGGIIIFEIPGLIYRKYWRELIFFFLFLFLAFIISSLTILGVNIPNPTLIIEKIVTFFLEQVNKIF